MKLFTNATHLLFQLILLLSLTLALSCTEKEDKDEESTEEDETSASTLDIASIADNSLASAIPLEVQVASPTTSDGSEIEYSADTLKINLVAGSKTGNESYVEKVSSIFKLLKAADASSCKPYLDFTLPPQPKCYNQLVTKESNPKSTSSDLIIFPDNLREENLGSEPEDGRGFRVLDDTAGMLAELEGNDPCGKAVAEYFIQTSASTVDKAQNLMGSMLCAGKVKGKQELPAAGKELDLLDVVKEVWQDSSLTIKKALILNEGKEGETAKYRSVISLIRKDSNGDQQSLLADLQNIPDKANPQNYQGRFLIYDQRRKHGVTTPTMITVNYQKEGNNITFILKESSFNFDIDPKTVVDSKGMLDFDKIGNLKENNANGIQAQFELHTLSGNGKAGYMSAPSVMGEEVPNVFIVSVDKDDSKALKGCALLGNTKGFTDTVTLKGKYCMKNQSTTDGPSFGGELPQNGFADFGYVQKQCFGLSGSDWKVSSNNLTWAVAEKCGVGSSNHGGDVDLIPVDQALKEFKLPKLPTTSSISYDSSVGYKLDMP